VIVVALVFLVGPNSSPRSDPLRCENLFVPAFFQPPVWTAAIASSPRVMILDITATGAGSARQPVFARIAQRAQAADITVLGYSSTQYGTRSIGAIEADIRHYRSWYKVTSVFLDEMSASAAKLGYYEKLDSAIRSVDADGTIWMNPGTYPAQSYMALDAVMMVFEGPYADYVNLQVPSWADQYPATRFAQTIFAAPSSVLPNVLSLAAQRHAGYVFVTDDTGDNPYGALPSYYTTEASSVASSCHG
jgi:hypothetical protein